MEIDDINNTSNLDIGREQVFSLLVSSITHDVYQKIEEKESKSRNIFISVSSLVLVIIVSIGGYLMNQVLDITVERKLERMQKETLAKSLFAVDIAALDIEARALKEGNGYSKEEAESIIRKIDRLYKEGVVAQTNPKIINDNIEKLIYSVSAGILSFAQSGRIDYLLELERKAPLVAQESDEVPVVMTISLGDKLIQDPKSPESWQPDGFLSSEYTKFLYYLKKAKSEGYPELFILYELLMGQVNALPVSDMEPLVNDLEDLSPNDMNNFKKRMSSIIRSNDNAGEIREKKVALGVIEQMSIKSPVLKELWAENNE